MSSLFAILPLVLMFVFYALLIKLAAKTYRNSVLAWKHAFAFAALAMFVGIVGALLNRAAGLVLAPMLAVVLGFAIQLAIGGWYLGPRTRTSSGEPVAFKGGALVAAIAYGFVALIGIAAAVLLPLLNRGSQA